MNLRKCFIALLLPVLTGLPAYSQYFPEEEDNIRLSWDEANGILSVWATNWAANSPGVTIQSLSTIEKPRHRIAEVKLDGYSGELKWIRDQEGLKVGLPLEEISDRNFALTVSFQRKPNYLPHEYYNYQNSINNGIEKVPVPEYQWASEEAYEAMNDIKYGIRIHWGIYSLWNIEASWDLMKMSNEKRMEYADLYRQFNPENFDADSWMNWFRENGMKMFAFTSKHHDGFSMFDTKTVVTERINWTAEGGPKAEPFGMEYDIMQTPFNRDVVKELCESARKHGIKIDLYFTNPDWFDADQRGFATIYPEKNYFSGTAGEKELKRGMERHREQLMEILANYGKIDMVCLDMWLDADTWPEMRKTMLEVREIQPDVMFRCRNIGNYGDYYTPEGFVPGNVEATNMPWFVIYPLGKIFAYDPEPGNYKSGHWIINNVIDATAKGGNFMVCIGPDRNGDFHPAAMKSVEDAGDWLRLNGEAIFSTRPWNIFGEGPTAEELVSSSGHEKKKEITYSFEDIRFTRSKDRNTLYAILMGWPGNGQSVTIKSLSSIAEPGHVIDEVSLIGFGVLTWSREDDGLKVTFPDRKPCDYAYTLKINLSD